LLLDMNDPTASTTQNSARLRALFEACSDLDQDARAAFLREQDIDGELRALLDAMLLADARVEDVFEIPASAWAEQLAPIASEIEAMVGTTIGGFHISALLGHGGSAVVFRAERQVAGAIQTVALKLLRNGLFSSEAQRRFRREQSILTQLSHPNIAHLIDAGISTAGIPFIAMELVDGLTLTDYAERQTLTLPERLHLLADLGRAVDAAHRALIVHRDLKPSNVLVNAEGQVKVLDFGIAKLLGDEAETATQHISLTPGYAAPEQYRSGAVSTAVDVYALGVIAAELLIGARLGPDAVLPREGDHIDSARRRWRLLDSDLTTLLRTALASEPAQRYASARHFADDIEHYLRDEPIAAHAPSRSYRARKFFARNRLAVVVSSAFVLALMVALGAALWQARIARAEAARADSMRDFMFDAFAEAEPSVPRDGPVTVLDAVRRAIVGSRSKTGTDVRARLELRARLAQVLQRQGDIDGAGALLDETFAEATATLGSEDELTYEISVLKAKNAIAAGQFDAARLQIDALLRRQRDDRDERGVELLSLSAVLATKVRERERALDEGRRAVAWARSIGDAELLRQTLNDFAIVLLSVDALPEAVSVFEELLTLNRTLFGEQHQKVANVQAGLARAYRRLGDLDRAEAAARAAIAIDREIYPGDNWNTALHLNSLMMALDFKGDLNGALEASREALRINRITLGDDHPDTLIALYGLGSLEIKRESYAAAVPLLQEALIGSERQFGAPHWGTAVRRAHYGFALAMSGAVDAGTQELERAIADFEALDDPDLDKLSAAIEKRIRLALHAGEGSMALHWIARLERYSADAPVQRASWPGNVDCLRGEALLALHDVPGALQALTRAGVLMDAATDVAPPLRAEHSVLLATALSANGTNQQVTTQARAARQYLSKLQYVPRRLVALEAALPH
jgi:eukaryotic-like serine/threonine-protein kinase